MLEWLFSWEFASVAVAVLIGAGFAVLAFNDFKLAKAFFLIAAADAAGGIIMWGTRSQLPDWQVALVAFLAVGLAGAMAVLALRYVDTKRANKTPSPSPTSQEAPHKAELHWYKTYGNYILNSLDKCEGVKYI